MSFALKSGEVTPTYSQGFLLFKVHTRFLTKIYNKIRRSNFYIGYKDVNLRAIIKSVVKHLVYNSLGYKSLVSQSKHAYLLRLNRAQHEFILFLRRFHKKMLFLWIFELLLTQSITVVDQFFALRVISRLGLLLQKSYQ